MNDDKDGDLSWWNDFVVSSHYDRTASDDKDGDLLWWNDFVVSSHYDRTSGAAKDGDLSWWNDFVVSSHYDRTSRATRCGTSPWWMGLVLSAHYGESCACYTLYDLGSSRGDVGSANTAGSPTILLVLQEEGVVRTAIGPNPSHTSIGPTEREGNDLIRLIAPLRMEVRLGTSNNGVCIIPRDSPRQEDHRIITHKLTAKGGCKHPR